MSPEIRLHSGPRRMMVVLAHPDDESFGVGGTIAIYARRGVEVSLICATRGEAGTVAPELMNGYDSVGSLREAELRDAARELGIKEIIFLNKRDSGLPGMEANNHPDALIKTNLSELGDEIARHIRRIKPQIVITFDPYGGYGHPDHIHLQRATHIAFNQIVAEDADYAPQKLYDYTIAKTMMRWMVRFMPLVRKDPHHFGQHGDIDLTVIAEKDFPIHAVIGYNSVREQRMRACACYISQGGTKINDGMAGLLRGWMGNHEYFIRAYPPAGPNVHETDLFDGID